MNITRRPVTIGLTIDVYEAVLAQAMKGRAPGEYIRGCMQRWLERLIDRALAQQGITPGNAAAQVEKPEDFGAAPPGSAEEARQKIAYYLASETKPEQYPPVVSRHRTLRLEWEAELTLREARPGPGTLAYAEWLGKRTQSKNFAIARQAWAELRQRQEASQRRDGLRPAAGQDLTREAKRAIRRGINERLAAGGEPLLAYDPEFDDPPAPAQEAGQDDHSLEQREELLLLPVDPEEPPEERDNEDIL